MNRALLAVLVVLALVSTSTVGVVGAVGAADSHDATNIAPDEPTNLGADLDEIRSEGALAQVEGEENSTVEEDGAEEDSESDAREVVVQVDSRLDVVGKRYDADNQTMFVTLRNSDERRGGQTSTVTLTELIDRDAHGATARFGIRSVDVEPGETVRVGVFARRVDGRAGVMVVTAESVENGEGRLVQEPPSSASILRGPSTWTDVRASGFFALLGSILVVVLAAWHVVASRHEEFEAVDLNGGRS